MFEDFKQNILEHNNKDSSQSLSTSLSSEVLKKCKQDGIDPDNVTLQQLFSTLPNPQKLYLTFTLPAKSLSANEQKSKA